VHNSVVAHPPRIPVWLRWDQDVVYFVTFCVERRELVLANPEAFAAFRSAIARLQKWRVLAGLVMPDHVHILAAPADRETTVGNLSGSLRRWMRHDLAPDWQWQAGSFDRLLRSSESLSDKWAYIEQNPVRAGLVARAEDWPYSLGFADEL
jgi:REP element-mobilizing transposase RayT